MKKQSTMIKLFAVILGATTLFSSCKKIVTSKKLDGAWTVTSGEQTSTSSYTTGSVTTTYTSTSTFDGSEMTTSTTSGNVTTTTSSDLAIEYTFDKKTGEYTSVTNTNDPEYDYDSYIQVYDDAAGSFTNYEYVDRNTARESVTTSEGFFTITGNAGEEIEKNSQVTFQERSEEETYTDTYTYTISGTSTTANVSGKYYYDYNVGTYVPFTSSNSGTSTNTGEDSYAMVWNVVELKGGEMSVEYTDESEYTNSGSSNSSSYKTEVSWTLTEQE